MHADSARKVTPKKYRALRGAMAILVAVLVPASCRPLEQGYWTKPGMSDAAQSAEYRQDSEECARQGVEQVAMSRTSQGDTIVAAPPASEFGSIQYRDCMTSRGYEWIKLQPLVPPSPHHETANQAPCPTERIVLDPYGYPHCAIGTQSVQDGVRSQNPAPAASTVTNGIAVPREPLPQNEAPRKQSPAMPPSLENGRPHNELPPAQRREFDNSLCIQHSQQSLSNPYDTYLRCMEEKGWPPLPR